MSTPSFVFVMLMLAGAVVMLLSMRLMRRNPKHGGDEIVLYGCGAFVFATGVIGVIGAATSSVT